MQLPATPASPKGACCSPSKIPAVIRLLFCSVKVRDQSSVALVTHYSVLQYLLVHAIAVFHLFIAALVHCPAGLPEGNTCLH